MTESNGSHTRNQAEPAAPGLWLGVNYWSRAGGPRMWDRYDAAVVREELAVLTAHGCTMTRSFCYWPDFVPEPEMLDEVAWGIEVTGNDNGYSLRELAPLVDFIGPHVYPMQDDEVRQLLTAAFTCELSGSFGKPVVLEEFGVSSDFASDENASDYYRQVLYTSLLAGARGWIAWNNCAYDDIR